MRWKLALAEAAERTRPPFQGIEPQCSFECGRVLVSARIELAPGKVQIAAQVVDLGERAVGSGGARRRLGFRQRGEGVVELGEQPVRGGGADQRADTVLFGAAIGKRAVISFERLPPAAGVKFEIAGLQGEVEAGLRIGCDGQSAARKRDRLVLPEEGLLVFRSGEVGARRLGIGGKIEMLGPERWLVRQHAGGASMKLSPRARVSDA